MNSFAGNVQTPNQQPQNIGPSWNAAAGGIGGIDQTYGGLGASVLPQAQQNLSNLTNNPGQNNAIGGAWNASQLGQQGALAGYGTGQNLAGAGMSLLPYAQNIMQTGFDPQQQLYARTQQQVTDQSRASEAARGIDMSPYGAGLENDQNRNFNIDWQNQQLGRQATAAGAAGGLTQAGAGVAGQGINMMNQAPGQMMQSAMLPYATYSGIGQDQNQAIMQMLGIGGAGANLANLPIQDWMGMISAGNQANQVANQTAQTQLNQSQLGWNQMAQLGKGLGSAVGSGWNWLTGA